MPKDKPPKNQLAAKTKKRPIEQYDHKGKKRVNNPPVGLVTPQTDPPTPTHRTYEYDPHLDPQLVWAGKKEHASFEVPTVSLHVHETIDPRTIVDAVRRRNGNGLPLQPSLFERPEENLPLRDAIDFYRHAHGWSNRLIAGDSLLIMNSLLEKEGMAGQVQMVYIDPPYGIKYGSNFQPFVNRREVKDGKDEDLTQEPEMVRAFRDTWELGIHSYLTYLRDRLFLARDLLHESGSCFVQISDENVHRVRDLMDELFGSRNLIAEIVFQKTGSQSGDFVQTINDYVCWYAKDADAAKRKFRPLFLPREEREESDYSPDPITSGGETEGSTFEFSFQGRMFHPGKGAHWKTTREGMERLVIADRIVAQKGQIRFKRFWQDFPAKPLSNVWADVGGARDIVYVVQTNTKIAQRCLLMTTDPGDLIFDPTCGS